MPTSSFDPLQRELAEGLLAAHIEEVEQPVGALDRVLRLRALAPRDPAVRFAVQHFTQAVEKRTRKPR